MHLNRLANETYLIDIIRLIRIRINQSLLCFPILLLRLEQLNQLVQGDVERFMEQQKVMETVKELKQKKALIEYRMARERWQEMNSKKKGASELLFQANKHLEPVQMLIRDSDKQVC